VYPPGKATVSGGKTGTFTATEEGTYTVFFSGASQIPAPLGRQFAQTEVSVGKGEEKCASSEETKGLFEFKWIGGCWDVYHGNEYANIYDCGTDKVELPEGSYTIKPRHDKSFIPFNVTIQRCQTNTIEMGGIFEFKWTGGCWDIYRGDESTGIYDCGTDKVGLQEGSYTIKPRHDKSFIPFNITVAKGQTTTVEMGGIFEFKWTGGCWDIYRGDESTGIYDCGTDKVGLQEGSYTIKPRHDKSFIPFNITVAKGQTTTVEMGGILECKFTTGCGDIYRGKDLIGYICGAGHIGLQEGSYSIKSRYGNPDDPDPKNQPPFKPFSVTVAKGQTTTVSK